MTGRTRQLLVTSLAAGALAVPAAPALAADPPMQPGMWLTSAEVKRLPMKGKAWKQLEQLADESMGRADLSDQDSEHDVHVLAAALVWARTGDERYRRKAAAGISKAVDTEGGRTLALSRGLVSYVVAADLVDLERFDPDKDERFREWLRKVRTERLKPSDNPTLILTHERRPNNWGTHAGASRIAVAIYLDDQRDLKRAAAVFKGWLGDRSTYRGFRFGDRSWQANAKAPVAIDPAGAEKGGESIDGALPEEMRRGCDLRFPPCPTLYAWEAMQGAVVQAELLSRQGYDAWNWGDQALRRATAFLFDLEKRYGDEEWGAPAGHSWVPWLINARYGTSFPTTNPARPGKGMGFTDWTAARRCSDDDACAQPRGTERSTRPIAAVALADDRADGTVDGTAVEDEGTDWTLAGVVAAGVVVLGLAVRSLTRLARR